MATHPKVQGLTLDPKLAYNTHIHNISVHAHTPLQIIQTLSMEQTEGDTHGYLQGSHETSSGSCLFHMVPLSSLTSINNRKVMQNAALWIATGCTQDTNICMTKTHTSHAQAPRAPRITIQTENTTSITSPSQTYFNTSRLKIYIQQRPQHNKHSYRRQHSHYDRHKTNMHHTHTSIVSSI